MGHTVKRCPQPDPDAADANGEGLESGLGKTEVQTVAPEGDWANGDAGENDWETATPAKASADAW